MALIKVNSQDLRRVAQELEQLNGQFKTQVGRLESYEGTLNGQWDGDANNLFHNAFIKDKTQFDVFYNGIREYIQKLLNAAQEYERAEERSRDIAKTRKA